ncbi:hypothetical protein IDM48_04385 [Rothia amarae]|uniref:Uncharacterized protein n=1 Tax=Rothia amarae TaxID=169480 RepID=A0A7H2BLV0_9MICC|nr:hypothetical protein [Rothia amarae]QNV40646.1 hypothetical protein IDM48_04385 [Rothia amarae]
MAKPLQSRTTFKSKASALAWADKERVRLANLERECVDILNDRDDEVLTLRVENRALKEALARAEAQRDFYERKTLE